MNDYKIDYANRIKILKPDIPEYNDLGNVNEDEMIDASSDEMNVADDDEMSKAEDENTDEQQRLCKPFERLNLNKTNLIGILLFEDSKDLESKSDKPFLGKDEFGDVMTYNTKGNLIKMLYFLEILNYFDEGNHNHAFALISNVIF